MDNKEKEKVLDEERMTDVSGGQVKPITYVNGVYWRRCTECGVCVEICKEYGNEAVSFVNGAASIDKTKCDGCYECEYNCPEQCIDINGLFGWVK